jgi:hypothetical protein
MSKLNEKFMIDSKGDLYDTSRKNWAELPPLRACYSTHVTDIQCDVKRLKACLRAGQFSNIGGYQLYFVTVDGGALSFNSVLANLREVMSAIKDNNDPQWQVEYLTTNDENSELYCDHSGKKIPSNYADEFPFEEIRTKSGDYFDSVYSATSAGYELDQVWSVTIEDDVFTYGPSHHYINLLGYICTSEKHDSNTYFSESL